MERTKQMTHLIPTHISLSRLAGAVRICGRRIALRVRWRAWPSWLRTGLAGVSLCGGVWLLLVGVLLAF